MSHICELIEISFNLNPGTIKMFLITEDGPEDIHNKEMNILQINDKYWKSLGGM